MFQNIKGGLNFIWLLGKRRERKGKERGRSGCVLGRGRGMGVVVKLPHYLALKYFLDKT